MMGDPLLSVFPPALLRLILCGGGGLPTAWGPLEWGYLAPWNPARGEVVDPMFLTIHDPLRDVGNWRLPLDHWRARIEIVAAWMLGFYAFACTMRVDVGVQITFRMFELADTGPDVLCWDAETGAAIGDGRDLPTLPRHYLIHDPAVALLLSLFDVPEIRARIMALAADAAVG